MERVFAEHGVKLASSMELASNETIKQAVMAGMGLAFLSLHTVGLELAAGKLVRLDVRGTPVTREWHVVSRLGKRLSPLAEAFRAFLARRRRRAASRRPPACDAGQGGAKPRKSLKKTRDSGAESPIIPVPLSPPTNCLVYTAAERIPPAAPGFGRRRVVTRCGRRPRPSDQGGKPPRGDDLQAAPEEGGNGVKGLHIIADLYGCRNREMLASSAMLRESCVAACKDVGLTVLGDHFYQFEGLDATQVRAAPPARSSSRNRTSRSTPGPSATAPRSTCTSATSPATTATRRRSSTRRSSQALRPDDILVERIWRGRDLPVRKKRLAAVK